MDTKQTRQRDGGGVGRAVGGRARRHLTLAVNEQAELIGLLNSVAQAVANEDNADQIRE
jgi:hypothetical protein